MTDSNSELTPEAKAILGRARRSFMVSMGLLFAGLIAVGAVIVYKAQPSGGSGAVTGGADYALAAVKIPAGATLISAVAADGKVTVTYAAGGVTTIEIIDGRSGDLVRSLQVTTR